MSQDTEKELQQQRNRFQDLAQKAFQQNIYTFTGFLGLSEQDLFWSMEPKLRYAGYAWEGGTEQADRKMLRFGNKEELGYEVPFPIVCVHIEPLLAKFADALSHRDFLGALMNLGIERSTLGDIKCKNNEAYLFCTDTIAPYIVEQLHKIKHTNVKCSVCDEWIQFPQEEPTPHILQVSSLRVDVLIAKVYNLSRNDCLELFRTGKIFVDGRCCENNASLLKGGEAVNARGFGKFLFVAAKGETKKGKINAEVAVYC